MAYSQQAKYVFIMQNLKYPFFWLFSAFFIVFVCYFYLLLLIHVTDRHKTNKWQCEMLDEYFV